MKTSYPLREYSSSKKNDDYSQLNDQNPRTEASIDLFKDHCSRFRCRCRFLIFLVLIVICLLFFYLFIPRSDPTCFKEECLSLMCNAYQQGLIGGHLCPDLCTRKTILFEDCLGQHQHFRSRLFQVNEENQVIRCYLKYPLTQIDQRINLNEIFHYPREESNLNEFIVELQNHVQKQLELTQIDSFIEKLIRFSDFNHDEKISLSEARSLWSLVQIDEFLYSMLLNEKSSTPKILSTCGNLFSIEKVDHPKLPFNKDRNLLSDRPNWFQRVRLSIGIIEFIYDSFNYDDTEENLYLCQSIYQSFGFDKNYEAKLLKMNNVFSSKSIVSRLPRRCHSDEDCSFDCSIKSFCNQTSNSCQLSQFSPEYFNQFCSFLSKLLLPDGNSTFIQSFQPLIEQCQQIAQDGQFSLELSFDSLSFRVRQTVFLQNLRNYLWSLIEYQMSKITPKSTKHSLKSQTRFSVK